MLTDTFRTRMFFDFQRRWHAWWPFEKGRQLPSPLRRVFEPFVPVWVQLEPGLKMLLDPDDLVSRVILRSGAWEDAATAVRRSLTPGSTFVDVGAHIGFYTLNAALSVGPTGHVIAIEPNPETAKKLAANVGASGTGVVRIESVACFDSEAILSLYSASASNTGKGSLSSRSAAESFIENVDGLVHTVRARTLDAIISDLALARVDVIKIDAEGSEHRALLGAQETLAKHSPVLFVELEDELLGRMQSSSSEVISFLRSRGYEMVGRFDEANFEFRPIASAGRG